MLESFYVVPDYERPKEETPPVMRLTEKKVLRTSERDVEMERLTTQVELLTAQNHALTARVAELENDKKIMRQSVMTFREELGRSMLKGSGGFVRPRSESPIASAGLENLLEMDARSVLVSPPPGVPNRSPSPDIHEYIRNLERKVERQQRDLDDWQKLYAQMQHQQKKQ